jgi:hypothetical protein
LARPKKQTVDYFSHDCNCLSKKTLYIIDGQYGNDGYALWFKLLELLGTSNGHFINCNDKANWNYFLARVHLSEEKALQIIENLVRLKAIDPELWNKKIIWIQNYVDRLEDVYNRRRVEIPKKPDPLEILDYKDVEVNEENIFNKKQWCRNATHKAIKKGMIEKKPCKICGDLNNIEIHHYNYDDPNDIVFFCKKHHREYHKEYVNNTSSEQNKCTHIDNNNSEKIKNELHNHNNNPQIKLKESKVNNINTVDIQFEVESTIEDIPFEDNPPSAALPAQKDKQPEKHKNKHSPEDVKLHNEIRANFLKNHADTYFNHAQESEGIYRLIYYTKQARRLNKIGPEIIDYDFIMGIKYEFLRFRDKEKNNIFLKKP